MFLKLFKKILFKISGLHDAQRRPQVFEDGIAKFRRILSDQTGKTQTPFFLPIYFILFHLFASLPIYRFTGNPALLLKRVNAVRQLVNRVNRDLEQEEIYMGQLSVWQENLKVEIDASVPIAAAVGDWQGYRGYNDGARGQSRGRVNRRGRVNPVNPPDSGAE